MSCVGIDCIYQIENTSFIILKSWLQYQKVDQKIDATNDEIKFFLYILDEALLHVKRLLGWFWVRMANVKVTIFITFYFKWWFKEKKNDRESNGMNDKKNNNIKFQKRFALLQGDISNWVFPGWLDVGWMLLGSFEVARTAYFMPGLVGISNKSDIPKKFPGINSYLCVEHNSCSLRLIRRQHITNLNRQKFDI